MDTETMAKPFKKERKRALYTILYDLQGGPFPEEARKEAEAALMKVAIKHKLGIDTRVE